MNDRRLVRCVLPDGTTLRRWLPPSSFATHAVCAKGSAGQWILCHLTSDPDDALAEAEAYFVDSVEVAVTALRDVLRVAS